MAARIFLILIGVYRLTLSSIMGRRCRFMPSCSEYAADAIRRHGAWPGFWLAVGRIMSCNPWGGHGFDPVPEKIDASIWRFWKYKHPPDR